MCIVSVHSASPQKNSNKQTNKTKKQQPTTTFPCSVLLSSASVYIHANVLFHSVPSRILEVEQMQYELS